MMCKRVKKIIVQSSSSQTRLLIWNWTNSKHKEDLALMSVCVCCKRRMLHLFVAFVSSRTKLKTTRIHFSVDLNKYTRWNKKVRSMGLNKRSAEFKSTCTSSALINGGGIVFAPGHRTPTCTWMSSRNKYFVVTWTLVYLRTRDRQKCVNKDVFICMKNPNRKNTSFLSGFNLTRRGIVKEEGMGETVMSFIPINAHHHDSLCWCEICSLKVDICDNDSTWRRSVHRGVLRNIWFIFQFWNHSGYVAMTVDWPVNDWSKLASSRYQDPRTIVTMLVLLCVLKLGIHQRLISLVVSLVMP